MTGSIRIGRKATASAVALQRAVIKAVRRELDARPALSPAERDDLARQIARVVARQATRRLREKTSGTDRG